MSTLSRSYIQYPVCPPYSVSQRHYSYRLKPPTPRRTRTGSLRPPPSNADRLKGFPLSRQPSVPTYEVVIQFHRRSTHGHGEVPAPAWFDSLAFSTVIITSYSNNFLYALRGCLSHSSAMDPRLSVSLYLYE